MCLEEGGGGGLPCSGVHDATCSSTTSFLGGKNPFLGIAYITVGFVCIALAAAFALKSAFQPRATGDTQYLQWTPARAS